MTDTDTQNASVSLYRFLCQNIVGTEEQVKSLRMINNVRDNLVSDNFKVITSGSFGEGIDMRGGDLDIMYLIKNVEVCETTKDNFEPGTTYFEMNTEDTPPGYTRLRLVVNCLANIVEDCEEVEGKYYFSNIKIKKCLLNYMFMAHYHGPCVTDRDEFCDLAVCVRSKLWLQQANQWITRSNNSWPGNDVKQSIVQHGVLFVPVGVKGSMAEDLEWRISFSVGEKLLVYNFKHTQLLCYALMKILLKDVIAIDLDCKELLCSYFLKTILFWISEELSPSQWIEENLICCFMKCFRRLIYCVKYSVCPHYFIPANNLFANKIKGQAREILTDKLYILNSYGWKCILFSDQIPNIHNLVYCMRKEPIDSNVDIIKRIFYSIRYFCEEAPMSPHKMEHVIHKLLSIKSTKIKYIYTFFLSKMFYFNAHALPFNDISGNKSTYSQYNICISTVLQSTRHNAVSGWLLLASLIYKTKQYKKTLDILQYSLLKCTSEKLYQFRNLSNIHHELLTLYIFRKMPVVRLYKFLLLKCIDFDQNSTLRPDEIEIEMSDSIPPVVFAHFLQFLCFYHLNDTRQVRNSLCDLQLTIEENYFIAHSVQKALSYYILGVSFQLIENFDSARQAFMQSIELNPDNENNNAYYRLSLIS